MGGGRTQGWRAIGLRKPQAITPTSQNNPFSHTTLSATSLIPGQTALGGDIPPIIIH